MKALEPIAFDVGRCQQELDELRGLLGSNRPLRERADILPFFRARRHLSAMVASYSPRVVAYDRVAWEFDLFGDFACDLVAGDVARGAFVLVEFEDAKPGGLFVTKRGKSTPEWSPRFEHGFGQLVDWMWKLHDMARTDAMEERFGGRHVSYLGLLVVGRSEALGTGSSAGSGGGRSTSSSPPTTSTA